jgi:hypothetical protein
MEIYQLFYSRVPIWAQFTIVSFLSLVILSSGGVFIGNITDMYTGLGEYNEPYIMGFNTVYIGLGLGLIFIGKLNIRFSNKYLVLTGLGSMLFLHFIIASTTSPELVVVACLLLGFTKVLALGPVYLDLLGTISKTFDTSKVYPYLYFLALGGLYGVNWLMNYIAFQYNWQQAYVVIYIAIAISIILVAFFVENHPLRNSIPLYQSDILGLLLLTAFLMLINYIVVYGKVENWFESHNIIIASFVAVLSLLLFIVKEMLTKRPFLNPKLFTENNFALGLFYFFILGIFLPATFQTSFSSGVLHFESLRNSEINLYMLPGIALGCIVSYVWYNKKLSGELLIIIGFLTFIIYHVIMYNYFTNDLALEKFWVPSIIKGFAMAVLYIAIGLLTTAKFPLAEVLKVSGTMVIVRSFLGTGTFSGIYSYLLSSGRLQHLNYLASQTDSNEILTNNIADGNFLKNISNQAILSASKEVTGLIIIFGILFVFILVLRYFYKKIAARISG